jgi:hypothetical protein
MILATYELRLTFTGSIVWLSQKHGSEIEKGSFGVSEMTLKWSSHGQ